MSYSVEIRKKVIEVIEGGKGKAEVGRLLKIGETTIYRWLKKQACGESLKPGKKGSFMRKIDPKMLKEYVEKHPDHTLAEMKQNLGFGINSICKTTKDYIKKKSYCIKNVKRKIGRSL